MGTMIYLWRIASECPDNCIAVHDKQTVDPTLFRKAVPFDGAQPVRFTFHGKRSAVGWQDFLPNSAMLPLVSKAAALRLADAAGDIIQIVQAVVVCDDGELEATLINLLKPHPPSIGIALRRFFTRNQAGDEVHKARIVIGCIG